MKENNSEGKEPRIITDESAVQAIVGDLLKQNASAKVLSESDFQPNTPVVIEIPKSDFYEQEAGRIETEFRFLEGDLSPVLVVGSPFAQVRFEITDKEGQPDYVVDILGRGGRVFVTESDSWLIIHSEESLQNKQNQEIS